MTSPEGVETLKQLLPYGESTVIETVIQKLKAAGLKTIVTVLGHHAVQITEPVSRHQAEIVINPDYQQGMLTSIQAGIGFTLDIHASQTDGFLLCLVDQPGLRPETMRTIMQTAAAYPGKIIIPAFQDHKGHPVYIPVEFADEILALPPDQGLRALMQQHPEAIQLVPLDDSWIIRDMDTPEDYQAALRELS